MNEQRQDWLMRQFVDHILAQSLPLDEKRSRMHARGVPTHVQARVLGLETTEGEAIAAIH